MSEEFICPECNSTRIGAELRGSPIQKEGDPWSTIFLRIECASCRSTIPGPLAFRWNNLSVEEARNLWQNKYRVWPQSGVKNNG